MTLVTSLAFALTAALPPPTEPLVHGSVTATGTTTRRNLADRFADVVSVLDFGAKGDGEADDATAFNAALTAAKTVYAPPGTYRLARTVAIPSGRTLRGAGPGTVLVVPDTGFVGERVITNSAIGTGNKNITLEGVAVRVTAAIPVTGRRPGIIRFERVDGLTVRNIYTDTFDSAYTVLDLSGGVRNARIEGCHLRNVHPARSGGALWVRGGQENDATLDSYNIAIVGNTLESAYDEALVLYGWFNTVSRATVTGNVISNRGTTQLALGLVGYNLKGQDGVVQDVAVSGNAISGKTNILTGATRVMFSENTVTGPSGSNDAVFVNQYTVHAAPPTDITVARNKISGAGRYGVYAGGIDTIVRENEIHGTTSFGISDSSAGGAIIVGNVVTSTSTVGVFATTATLVARNTTIACNTGIALFGGVTNMTVVDNLIVNPTTIGISVNANKGTVTNVKLLRNEVIASAVTHGIGAFNGGTFIGCLSEANRVLGARTPYTLPAGWARRENSNWSGSGWVSDVRGTITTDVMRIAAGVCATDVTVTITGAAPGAECIAGGPPALPPSVLLTCFVSAPDTVKLRVCNNSPGAIHPPALTYSVRVFNP